MHYKVSNKRSVFLVRVSFVLAFEKTEFFPVLREKIFLKDLALWKQNHHKLYFPNDSLTYCAPGSHL